MGNDGRQRGESETVPLSGPPRPPRRATSGIVRFEHGDTLGRYVVLAHVGHGGMGDVLRAYDPRLQREVALKLIRGRAHAVRDVEARTRLVREAQAMAKLSHPNVLPVYDVEEEDDRLYIAMEYVEGETLAAWLRRGDRSWHEVLGVFRRAGAGLAAAHAMGIVHRDFKPSNVLVGKDGRVRVLDFGLALATADISRISAPPSHDSSTSHRLTVHGTVMGTPAYMAPEQRSGAETGPRSDQYSFCLALYEGLCGERPFQSPRDQLRPISRWGPKVAPRWLFAVVERGLALRPSDRWPSMDALLRALDEHARRRRLASSAAVGGLVVVGLGAWMGIRMTEPESICEGGDALIAEHWNAEIASSIASAFHDTNVPYADDAWERSQSRLDDYAERWIAGYRDACESTHLRKEQTEQALDLSMRCFHEARTDLAALLHVYSDPNATVVRRAAAAAASLSDPERCAAAPTMGIRHRLPSDATSSQRMDEIERYLARSFALQTKGDLDGVISWTARAVEASRDVDYPPLRVRALFRHGQALADAQLSEQAGRTLIEAYRLSLAEGVDSTSAHIAAEIVYVIGKLRHDRRLAERWIPVARGWMLREEPNDPRLRGIALSNVGSVLQDDGEYAEAEALFLEALRSWEQIGGPPRQGAGYLMNLGLVVRLQGRLDESEQYTRRALELEIEVRGPLHPDTAQSMSNLANVQHSLGHYAEAEKNATRALEILERSAGPADGVTAGARINLANILYAQGRLGEARTLASRAVATLERTAGERDPDLAVALGILATIDADQGDLASSEANRRRALEIFLERYGPTHPEVAAAQVNLGSLLDQQGHFDEADALYREALATLERSLPQPHVRVAITLYNRAANATARGQHAAAIELYSTALSTFDELLAGDHEFVAATLLGLWRACEATGQTAEGRRALERLKDLAARGDVDPGIASEVAAAARPG